MEASVEMGGAASKLPLQGVVGSGILVLWGGEGRGTRALCGRRLLRPNQGAWMRKLLPHLVR